MDQPNVENPSAQPYTRKNPYLAELTAHERLTKDGSLKDTRHFVLQLGNSGITYTPGDSLGTFARNSPALVDEILRLLEFSPDAPVKDANGGLRPLRQALMESYIL